MNIALICTNMLPLPAIRGGAIQTMIDGVLPYLSQNHTITIFSVADPDLPDYEKRENIQYHRIPAKKYAYGVARALRKFNFDLIHVFNRPRNLPLYKYAAPKSKFVLSLHNEMFQEHKITEKKALRSIQIAQKIMTVSDYIGNTVTLRFPHAKEKLRTVYSGVDINQFKPYWASEEAQLKREEMRRKYELEEKKVILFVGRLSKVKGPHILIEAMKSITEKYPDAVLLIIGGKWFSDHSTNQYVEELHNASDPIKDKVIFTNYLPNSEIPNYLLMGDVFVCSSQWQEPLARVHYEAMAAGLPIITTNRGGNSEVIINQENGLVIDEYQDPESFFESIDYLFSNPKIAMELGKKGRSLTEQYFDYSHVAQRLENVYRDVFKGNTILPVNQNLFPNVHFSRELIVDQLANLTIT